MLNPHQIQPLLFPWGKHPRGLIGKAPSDSFFGRVDRMGIGQIDIDIETEDYIPTKDFINIQVDAIAQVAVDTSSENIQIATNIP